MDTRLKARACGAAAVRQVGRRVDRRAGGIGDMMGAEPGGIRWESMDSLAEPGHANACNQCSTYIIYIYTHFTIK